MSRRFRFKLNRQGVRELLKGNEMQNVVNKHAAATLSSLGEGYAKDSYVGANRVNAMVYAETYKARVENSKNNTILKALK